MIAEKHPFKKALRQGIKAGVGPGGGNSLTWFQGFIKGKYGNNHVNVFTGANSMLKTKIKLGCMYTFVYEAKGAATLPYWDAQPLIFPFAEQGPHFWGINLHYLPPQYRAQLMDALYSLANDAKKPEKIKLRMTWNILQSMARHKLLAPCVKCYLKSNVRSQFLEVPYTYWNVALFMPLAQWQNSSQKTVFKESKKTIGKI